MSKKNRKNNKEKRFKTSEEKKNEIQAIKKEIQSLGLGEGNVDISSFYQVLELFIIGNETLEGIIPIKGYQRKIKYLLPQNHKNKCQVALLYDKTI